MELFALRRIAKYTCRHSCLAQVEICNLFAIVFLRSMMRCVGDGDGQEALDVCLTNQEVTARLIAKTPKGLTNTMDS